MKKVLENPDLRMQIISYAGINIEKECWICNEPIKYNKYLKSHHNTHKKIFDYYCCKYIYVCDDLCYLIYITHFKTNRGFFSFMAIITIIFICTLLFLFWISRLGL